MVNPVTATDTFEDHGFFVEPIGRNNHGHRPADSLLGRVAKKPLRRAVPTDDDTFEVLGKYRVVRRFDDRRVVLRGVIARQTFPASAPETRRSSSL